MKNSGLLLCSCHFGDSEQILVYRILKNNKWFIKKLCWKKNCLLSKFISLILKYGFKFNFEVIKCYYTK